MQVTPDQIGAWVTAALMAGAAAFERIRNAKHVKKRDDNQAIVSEAKAFQEKADIHAKLSTEYKERWEAEHEEFNKYRDYVHDKQNKDQENLTKAEFKISELMARPDFSDLFKHLEKQADVSTEILESLREMMQILKSKI